MNRREPLAEEASAKISDGISINGRLVRFYRKNEQGGEDEVTYRMKIGDGKANPFGWSTAKLVCLLEVDGFVLPHEIGEHYCGDITLSDPNYRFVDPWEPHES